MPFQKISENFLFDRNNFMNTKNKGFVKTFQSKLLRWLKIVESFLLEGAKEACATKQKAKSFYRLIAIKNDPIFHRISSYTVST